MVIPRGWLIANTRTWDEENRQMFVGFQKLRGIVPVLTQGERWGRGVQICPFGHAVNGIKIFWVPRHHRRAFLTPTGCPNHGTAGSGLFLLQKARFARNWPGEADVPEVGDESG